MNAFAFTADRSALSDALKILKRVIERRNTIPILSHVRFSATPAGLLTVSGTDLDIVAHIELPAAHVAPGSLCVEFAPLLDTLKRAKGEAVRMADIGGAATVTDCQSGAAFRLPALPTGDWPDIVPGDMLAAFDLPADLLRADLDRVRPAISTEETRYYLNGIYCHAGRFGAPDPETEEEKALQAERAELRRALADLKPEGADLPDIRERVAALEAELREMYEARTRSDRFAFAATDGHRLATVRRPLPLDIHADGMEQARELLESGFIIPRKTVALILALLGKAPKRGAEPCPSVPVRVNRAKIELRFGRVRIVSKLIDGTFPTYQRVIPAATGQELVIPAEALAGYAERVSAVANEKTRAVGLSLTQSACVIDCIAPDARAAEVMAEATFSRDGLRVGFNAAYVAGIAKTFRDSVIRIDVADASAPALILSDAAPELTYVLMPMRISGELMTPADVERLHMTPADRLKAEAPDYFASVASILAAPAETPELRKGKRTALRIARQQFGALARAAVEFLTGAHGRPVARWTVKAMLAGLANDPDALRRAVAIRAWHAGDAVPAAPEHVSAPVAAEPENMPEPANVATAQPEPESLPDPEPVADHIADAGKMAEPDAFADAGKQMGPAVMIDATERDVAALLSAVADLTARVAQLEADRAPAADDAAIAAAVMESAERASVAEQKAAEATVSLADANAEIERLKRDLQAQRERAERADAELMEAHRREEEYVAMLETARGREAKATRAACAAMRKRERATRLALALRPYRQESRGLSVQLDAANARASRLAAVNDALQDHVAGLASKGVVLKPGERAFGPAGELQAA